MIVNENRITELEIKIAYQEDLLQNLNTAMSNQQTQIYRLEETCKLLNEKIKNIAESEALPQRTEKPPHY
jgi:SlyX protein